jgi:hypothetical protein
MLESALGECAPPHPALSHSTDPTRRFRPRDDRVGRKPAFVRPLQFQDNDVKVTTTTTTTTKRVKGVKKTTRVVLE